MCLLTCTARLFRGRKECITQDMEPACAGNAIFHVQEGMHGKRRTTKVQHPTVMGSRKWPDHPGAKLPATVTQQDQHLMHSVIQDKQYCQPSSVPPFSMQRFDRREKSRDEF